MNRENYQDSETRYVRNSYYDSRDNNNTQHPSSHHATTTTSTNSNASTYRDYNDNRNHGNYREPYARTQLHHRESHYSNDNERDNYSYRERNNNYYRDRTHNNNGNREDNNDGNRYEHRVNNPRREEFDKAYEEYQNELKPYEKKEEDDSENNVEPILDFEAMGLNENLYRGIVCYGFEKPTPVQQYAIQLFTKDKDLIIQSQAGTGKTATFLIGAINKINEDEIGVQVIIIAPTRELAKQIQTVALSLSCYTKTKIVLCTKEKVMIPHNQIRSQVQTSPCMIIATPGKLCYFLKRGIISAQKLKLLIMDEADQLLSNDFIGTIKEIYSLTPDTSKTCLFSATMSEGFIKITKNFMQDPLIRILKPEELTLEGIKQYYYWVKSNDCKFNYLLGIYDKLSISQSIIYVNSANMAKELQYRLNEEQFTTSIIYGALSVEERNNVMKNFRSGKSRILISTDLLSRGIDIQQIAVVINYELPFDNQLDSYLHRIGRSGRFGRKGTAINFVTDRDRYKIDKIEKIYLTRIDKMPDNIGDIL
jgi:translation initiation factor 4A